MANYTVQKGDTLSAIAKKYGTTYQEIAKANGISDPNKIYAGQTLKIGSDNSSASNTSNSTTTITPAQTAAPTFNPTQSDAVAQKWSDYEAFKTQKPGEYNKTWYDSLQDTINQILNREKFSYDLNGDMLYQQYKDQYTTQGKLASMDVMGQAAAMTGGYGNSYAQTAGQQAYQGYLQQLNDKVPELYQLALNQYNQESQALYEKANLLGQMDETEWNRNQTQLDNYYKELGVLFDDAKYLDDTEYNRGLDKYKADYTGYWDQTNFDEGVRQYDEQFAYQKEQDAIANDIAIQKLKNSTGSDGKVNNGSRSEAEIIAMQNALGVTPDGKWGPKTQAAAKEQWGTDDADAAWEAKGNGLSGFTGTTYSEAVAYMKSKGVSGAKASNALTASEFRRATKYREVFDSYEEYLRAYVEDCIEQSAK